METLDNSNIIMSNFNKKMEENKPVTNAQETQIKKH